jgi:methyl-accepting chemotaxis protein
MINSQSIAKRIAVSLVITIVVVLGLISVVSYFMTASAENKNYKHNIKTLETQLSVILEEPVFAYDKELINKIIKSYLPLKEISSIKVTDHRDIEFGKVVNPENQEETNRTIKLTDTDGNHTGNIIVGFSKDAVRSQLAVLVSEKLITLVISSLLLAMILVILIRSIVVKPVQVVTNVLSDIAAGGGDLTQRIPVVSKDEVGLLATNFNNFIQTVQDIVSDVAQGTSKLTNVSAQVSNVSHMTVEGTIEQKEQTEQSLIYLQQMSSATSEIAQNAEITAATGQETAATAEKSTEDVAFNLNQVQSLVNVLDNNAQVATELRTESENIGSVLDVIKGIAEQTNLLALNAAIEAARAGESGRGFAVVADEVRALAHKTRQSTDEIESIISSLQSKAEESFDASHKSKGLVAETIVSVEKTSEAFNEISGKMNQINDMIIQVASATEEQALITTDVTRTMEGLCSAAQKLTQESLQMETSSEEMIKVEQQLIEKISQFKY